MSSDAGATAAVRASGSRVVILGGGFGGAYAAQALAKGSAKDRLTVTLLDRNNYMLFYPLMVEAGVGIVEPRHVVVPLRKFLRRGDFRMAEILDVDVVQKRVRYQIVGASTPLTLEYDHLVIALGSVTYMPRQIAGLADHGYELKSLGDAVELRDRAIRTLELANSVADAAARRDLLRVVVVGANFTGIEFAGEYHAFLTELSKDYPNVQPDEPEVVVLERSHRILGSVDEHLAEWCHTTLERRGVRIRTDVSALEVTESECVLSTGERIRTQTVVWAAGIAPNPLLSRIPGLPLNSHGYIDCNRDLSVHGLDGVWAIGDSATVLDSSGKPYAATAQNASRQGPHVAKNIRHVLRGEATEPFDFKVLGSFAAIGRRQAVADFKGRGFTGFFGWIMYRGAYLMKMPTFAVKLRLLMDWILEFFLHATPVQLGVRRADEPSTPQVGRSQPKDAETVG